MKLLKTLVFLLICFGVVPSVLACGTEGERPCGDGCDWYIKGYCPFCLPWCGDRKHFCHTGNHIEKEVSILTTSGELYIKEVCRKSPSPPPPPILPETASGIKVLPLPSRVETDRETFTGLEGFYAIIQLDKIDFVTPESDVVSPNRTFIIDGDGSSRPKTCTDFGEKDANGKVWKHALLNLTDWHARYRTELLINANWFDVRSPFESPNVNLCTNIFGLSVSKGRVITKADVRDKGNLLDALLMVTTKKFDTQFIKAVIVSNSEIIQYNTPQFAVSGFVILKNGVVENSSESNSPLIKFSRTAVGLSSDNKRMIIVVEQRGNFLNTKAGLNASQMAGLIKHYGANNAINLDNSGSSQLVYYVKPDDLRPKYISKKSDVIDCDDPLRVLCSADEKQEQEEGDGFVHRYRPVPNFLGFKIK